MFQCNHLEFGHGSIFTSAMLREIYNYPREFFRLLYKNFSDGIICGLDYRIDDENLILTAGVMKLDGEFYFMAEDLNLSELAAKNNLETDGTYYICLDKKSCKVEPCLTEKNLEVKFSAENNLPILGEVFYRGANFFELPTLKSGVNPFEGIFNRTVINLAAVEFAAKDFATFHPLLFRLVEKFLESKEFKTPLDFSILSLIQSGGTISLPTIKTYIATEEPDFDFSKCTRADLFENFCECLVRSEFKPVYVANETSQAEGNSRRLSRSYGKLL